ncbi:MAG TPA: hypothetical protein VNV85_06615 [Puia sp.]|nr:hypothetical protein [Puia sp.]
MEKPLEELSASALRKLLIAEIKQFIICLDYSALEELQGLKRHLRRIFDLLKDKEFQESQPLPWGKNSIQHAEVNPQTEYVDKIISEA